MWSVWGWEKEKQLEEWTAEESESASLLQAASRGGERGESLEPIRARGAVGNFQNEISGERVGVRVAEHMRVSVLVCAIARPYGGRLAQVDSLCFQSGFVVSRALTIEVMTG